MATARRNLLAGRLAEHLVCAELTRLELIATTFTHNVPTYDVLATDVECRTVPIQVKATRDKYWRSPATNWMHINMDEKEQIQRIDGQKQLSPLDPIWICVAVGLTRMDDQFFILTQDDIQEIIIKNYTKDLNGYSGKRPRNWKAVDCWWGIHDIIEFKDKWETIKNRLASPPTVAD